MFAATTGHVKVITLLLEAHASVNTVNSDGCTALMFAAARGHIGAISLLAAHNADLDTRDSLGSSALDHAISERHQLAVETLVVLGAELPRSGYRVSAAVMERRRVILSSRTVNDL